MANLDESSPAGWAVAITTEQRVRGQPVLRLCAVAVSGQSEAEEAVRNRDNAAPNEKVTAVAPLAQSTLDKVGVAPRGVRVL
jgi:hypothetical protein